MFNRRLASTIPLKVESAKGFSRRALSGVRCNCTGVDGVHCGDAENPYQPACTETVFLDNWGRKYPAYAPWTTAVYSNVSFAILGLVIERASGKSYSNNRQDAVFSPLTLKHTSVHQPLNINDALITKETGDGDISQGFLASAGAVYSSANDVYALGSSILNSALRSPVDTRAWLKPRTFTSSAGTFVGEVWEIARGSETAWQGVYETMTPAQVAKDGALFFFADATCQSWSEITVLSYGLVPVDQFVFTADEKGKNVAVNARAWITVMTRE